ncbi:hypothetical protein [Novosphingobium sp. BL-52-GroH]|uniref:hypothetical protein n=1 Tax=Novosphingobium sp. BL-52-GroH TaxID=3349877 RepID=UPI003850B6C4
MKSLNQLLAGAAAAALFLTAMPASAQKAPAPAGQGPDVAAQCAAMQQLAFLHGTWVGATTAFRPNGSKVTSLSKDVVTPLMDGELLAFAGSSYAPGATLADAPAMQNYGILSFDDRAGKLILTSFANGAQMRGEGRIVGPGHVEWTMPSPVGLLRFMVTAQGKDGWLEAIDVSADEGKSWRKFVEIAFRRAP